jgi:hypothetical protein
MPSGFNEQQSRGQHSARLAEPWHTRFAIGRHSIQSAVDRALSRRIGAGVGIREMPVIGSELCNGESLAQDDLQSVFRFPVALAFNARIQLSVAAMTSLDVDLTAKLDVTPEIAQVVNVKFVLGLKELVDVGAVVLKLTGNDEQGFARLSEQIPHDVVKLLRRGIVDEANQYDGHVAFEHRQSQWTAPMFIAGTVVGEIAHSIDGNVSHWVAPKTRLVAISVCHGSASRALGFQVSAHQQI